MEDACNEGLVSIFPALLAVCAVRLTRVSCAVDAERHNWTFTLEMRDAVRNSWVLYVQIEITARHLVGRCFTLLFGL